MLFDFPCRFRLIPVYKSENPIRIRVKGHVRCRSLTSRSMSEVADKHILEILLFIYSIFGHVLNAFAPRAIQLIRLSLSFEGRSSKLKKYRTSSSNGMLVHLFFLVT
jgi:hypothetical protein